MVRMLNAEPFILEKPQATSFRVDGREDIVKQFLISNEARSGCRLTSNERHHRQAIAQRQLGLSRASLSIGLMSRNNPDRIRMLV